MSMQTLPTRIFGTTDVEWQLELPKPRFSIGQLVRIPPDEDNTFTVYGYIVGTYCASHFGTWHSSKSRWRHDIFVAALPLDAPKQTPNPQKLTGQLIRLLENRIEEALSPLTPWDGDFDKKDVAKLERLILDIAHSDKDCSWLFNIHEEDEVHLEIFMTKKDEVDLSKLEWTHHQDGVEISDTGYFDVPEGWTETQIADLFWDGAGVYFRKKQSVNS